MAYCRQNPLLSIGGVTLSCYHSNQPEKYRRTQLKSGYCECDLTLTSHCVTVWLCIQQFSMKYDVSNIRVLGVPQPYVCSRDRPITVIDWSPCQIW